MRSATYPLRVSPFAVNYRCSLAWARVGVSSVTPKTSQDCVTAPEERVEGIDACCSFIAHDVCKSSFLLKQNRWDNLILHRGRLQTFLGLTT